MPLWKRTEFALALPKSAGHKKGYHFLEEQCTHSFVGNNFVIINSKTIHKYYWNHLTLDFDTELAAPKNVLWFCVTDTSTITLTLTKAGVCCLQRW